ncbi:MAG: DMT family transporter [Gemmatimonadales bacterium]|nr:MAG: DMT family transporter [Gemmatimonadales bacterium]
MKAPSRGFRYMAAGAFFFALMSLMVKVVGTRLPTMEVVLARSVVTLVLSLALIRHLGVSPWGKRRRLLFTRGALGFVALSSFYYAVIHLPLADATVIQYTNPVFTALLAALFLSERMGGREVAFALAGLGGVLVMARPTLLFGGEAPALPALPVAVAMTGALFSAAAYTTVRALGRTETPAVVVFWFSMVSVVAAFPLALRGFVLPRGWEWGLLLGIGVATQLGQLLLTMGLREERAGPATAVAYLQIVFAAGLGFLFLAEVPDRWTGMGAVVIVLATWGLYRRGVIPEPGVASGGK